MRPAPLALLAALLVAGPASAQCFAPVCGWGWGNCGPRFGFGYGFVASYSTVYVNPWVIAPPLAAVPLRPTPGVFTLADERPTSGGVDLTRLREKLARELEAEQQAKVKVAAAVSAGEVIVFEPGKAPPKRVEVPPAKIPDAPKPAPPTDPKVLAQLHLHKGQAAFDAGELGRATERISAAVAADPNLAEAHFNLAQVRIARGQYAEAVDAIRTGMKHVRDWPNATFRTADLYLANPKRLAEDSADLKAATDANPTDRTLAFLYAHQLWFGGEKAKAGQLFAELKDKVTEKELVEAFVK